MNYQCFVKSKKVMHMTAFTSLSLIAVSLISDLEHLTDNAFQKQLKSAC